MTEYLDDINAVNKKGDVVPRDDILEYDSDYLDDEGALSVAVDSFAIARDRKRLQSLASHPAMAGESLARSRQTELGEPAQALLDTFNAETDYMLRLGATDHKPRLKLMKALALGQAGRTISADETHAILAKIATDTPRSGSEDIAVELHPTSITARRRYRDASSAAANDFIED